MSDADRADYMIITLVPDPLTPPLNRITTSRSMRVAARSISMIALRDAQPADGSGGPQWSVAAKRER
jgi:hypothetical protein